MKKVSFLFVLASVLFSACGVDQRQVDEDLILDYLADNNLTAQSTSEGLYYVIDNEGAGARPNISNQVTVDYEGFLLDGTKFDSSVDRGSASTFPLSAVIEGWQIGIPKFRAGGNGLLIIPSHLAYGSTPPSGSVIGKNEVLIFTIDLISVN